MKYSVVTTAYNDDGNIEKYLKNIMTQTIKPIEIIIADGGSCDNTCTIIETYRRKLAGEIEIKLCTAGRLNIAEGFNLAIKSAKQEIIAITGVGNYFPDDYFEKLLTGMEHSDCEICYGMIKGERKNKFQIIYDGAFLVMDAQCKIPCNRGVLVKKSIFQKVGFFYENFIYAGEDAEFFYLAKRKGMKMLCIETANFIWETPENLTEFLKQTRNYTIAGLQIKETQKVILNTIVKLMGCTFSLTIIWLFPFIGCFLLACIFFVLAEKGIRNVFSIGLYLFYKLLTIFYTVRYSYYLKAAYKVKR